MYDPTDTEEQSKQAEGSSEDFPDSLTFFENELSNALEHSSEPQPAEPESTKED